MCDDTEAKTHSHHTIHGSVSTTKNESSVRIHSDKHHVMLTGPPSILPQPISPETLDRAECIYTLMFNAISQHPFFLNIVYGIKSAIAFPTAAQVAQKCWMGIFSMKGGLCNI